MNLIPPGGIEKHWRESRRNQIHNGGNPAGIIFSRRDSPPCSVVSGRGQPLRGESRPAPPEKILFRSSFLSRQNGLFGRRQSRRNSANPCGIPAGNDIFRRDSRRNSQSRRYGVSKPPYFKPPVGSFAPFNGHCALECRA